MDRKVELGLVLFLFASLFYCATYYSATVGGYADRRVYNLATGLSYATIQEAIDANETRNGQIIFVHAGTYVENPVVNKSISLVGEDRDTTIIDGQGNGNVVCVSADNVQIRGFTIRNSSQGYFDSGILLNYSNYATISDNLLTNCHDGINVFISNYTTVASNLITNNTDWGVFLSDSSLFPSHQTHDAFLIQNRIIGNGVGIILGQTSNDTIVDNDFENNYQGIVISGSASNVVVMENIITNIGRGEETKSPWIGSECGMYLHEASGAIIMENNITNGQEYGIRLEYSSNNTLKGNLIQNIKNLIWNSYFYEHSPAIFLYDSFNNTLIDNNVINNSFGIMTIKSGGNAIVHNNLINNTLQTFVIGEPYWPFGPPPANTWDYGYPSGGNYWSDYETEFPNATELDSSGIWSIPYQITTNNVDGYPLKSPVTIPEIPSALIPALLMITMTVAVIACRKWNETPET